MGIPEKNSDKKRKSLKSWKKKFFSFRHWFSEHL